MLIRLVNGDNFNIICIILQDAERRWKTTKTNDLVQFQWRTWFIDTL